jgi:hypothetical protein
MLPAWPCGSQTWSTVVQIWPAFRHLTKRMRSAAVPSGKSSATMAGDLPPSSSVTGHRLRAAAAITARPVVPLPVNSRWSKGSCEKATPTPHRSRRRTAASRAGNTAGVFSISSHEARGQLLHDLVGAAVDALHARIGVQLGDRVLASCSRSRRTAAGIRPSPALLLGDPVLEPAPRGPRRARPSGAPPCSVDEGARRQHRGLHLGELEAGVLEAQIGLPKAWRSLV